MHPNRVTHLALPSAVLSNVFQLLPQTDAPDPSNPCEISSAFNSWPLHLQPPPSNLTPLEKENASAPLTTRSMPSSTPFRTNSLTTIPKTLHPQLRTTTLNQAMFHTTRTTRTVTPRKPPTTSPHFPITLPRGLAKLTLLYRRIFLPSPQLSQTLPNHVAHLGSWTETSSPKRNYRTNYHNIYPTRSGLGHTRSDHSYKHPIRTGYPTDSGRAS